MECLDREEESWCRENTAFQCSEGIVFVDDSGAGAQGANQAKYYVRAQIAHLTETAAGIRYVGRHHQTVNALMQITEN